MSIEFFESLSDDSEVELSGFRNDIFVDNPLNKDLMPKIRFTTDASEAAEAANAKSGNPLIVPDSVFYAEPAETVSESDENSVLSDLRGFQNDTYDIKVDSSEQTFSEISLSDEYCGSSSAALDIKINEATKHLTFAQEQLEKTIENGGSVITAMSMVNSAQKVLDSYIQQYGKAVMSEAKQTANNELSAKNGDMKLGSVSHAQHELEKAYESGNATRIHNAEKHLAHEKAKEAAKS